MGTKLLKVSECVHDNQGLRVQKSRHMKTDTL